MSNRSPTGVMILADGSRPEMRAAVERLQPIIERYLSVTGVILDPSSELSDCDAELVMVLGGDGSILRAAHRMGRRQRPVIGVNLGKLGFLAALQPEQLDVALPEVAAGRHQIVDHLMFQCTWIRNGTEMAAKLGLNEVAVLAGPPFKILDVQLYVDGDLGTTYSCDGVIVSTPIGSTAHSLSAGGPILQKSLQAFVISPISPHTLTNRPVVDAADRQYELVVPHPNKGTTLVIDGEVQGTLTASDRVRIVRGEASFQMVEVAGQGYYRTLREKLGWGGQLKITKDG
jgi:NAD+ kinase